MTAERFTDLYNRYYKECYGYARTFLRRMNHTILQPEDLVHQVFMDTWRRGIFQTDEPSKLLCFFIRQRGVDAFRRMKVEQNKIINMPIYKEERWEELQSIKLLPPKQREVLSLTLEGYDGVEIAQITGSNHSTIRYRKREAINKLKKICYQ